jgi:hypothetical protein
MSYYTKMEYDEKWKFISDKEIDKNAENAYNALYHKKLLKEAMIIIKALINNDIYCKPVKIARQFLKDYKNEVK